MICDECKEEKEGVVRNELQEKVHPILSECMHKLQDSSLPVGFAFAAVFGMRWDERRQRPVFYDIEDVIALTDREYGLGNVSVEVEETDLLIIRALEDHVRLMRREMEDRIRERARATEIKASFKQ